MTDFDALYRSNPDPWAVRTSWYERRKRGILLAALPRERYRCALELGCGTGDTTCLLASCCGTVYAVDGAPAAIEQCAQAIRNAALSNVRLEVRQLPEAWPFMESECADLIVVSELAYYLSDGEFDCFLQRCMQSLAVEGDWLMCHYQGAFHDRRQLTDQMHQAVGGLAGLRHLITHDDRHFRLDVWRKEPGAHE